MTRPRTLSVGLGALAMAGLAVAGSAAGGEGRFTIVDDDSATVARALAPRADGGPGLRLDDGLTQFAAKPAALPGYRQAARVAGGVGTASAPGLLGRGAEGMAALLRDRVRKAGAHRVFVDEIGAAYRGRQGDDLAEALGMLAGERPSHAPLGVARAVNLYVANPGPLLTDPEWEGARAALTRAGGVWLKTASGESEWNGAQWLAWPGEMGALLAARGSLRSRVHVVFSATAPQSAQWTLARAGTACAFLASGPGAYRLGSAIDDFVAEYRRTLPVRAVSKVPVVGCTEAPSLTAAGARALDRAADLETAGLEIPPGGLITPPLSAGEPAQLTLRLGSDPAGLASALGLSSEGFWKAAQARLEVRGPGTATDVTIEADGVARLEFTPTAPGPVTMRVVIDQGLMRRSLGAEPEVVAPLRAAGVSVALMERIVADPSGWRLAIPLVPQGGAPGSPVVEIVPPPA